MDDLIAKKDVIKGAGQSAATLEHLKKQGVAAGRLVEVIAGKVPGDAKGIATGAGEKIAKAIQKGVVAFS